METIKVKGEFSSVIFDGKNDFQIIGFKPTGDSYKLVEVNNKFNTFTVKGVFPPLTKGEEYEMHLAVEDHPKYGKGYNLQFLKSVRSVNFEDKESFKSFLKMVTSEKNANEIVKTLENPKEVFESNDVETLCSVKGIGEKTALRLFENYDSHKDYSKAYIELGKYNIEPSVVKKIVNFAKSNEKAIDLVENNPYELMRMGGYGFKRCDEIFLKIHPNDSNSPFRIKAFIRHYMNDNAYQQGNTWVGLSKLVEYVASNIGANMKNVAMHIGEMIREEDTLSLTHKKKSPRIAHSKTYGVELNIAKHIFRLLLSENNFDNQGLEDMITESEKSQGWEFTSEQNGGIKAITANNIIILEGLAGTGKSTTLKTVLDFYSKKNYTFAQTALSGKASSNLALITGREGSTIHRLLGVDFQTGGFFYNENRKLPFDIIIVDEISMVDITIFEALIVAIKDGAKLVLVGDSEQLEAIGVPLMKPLIESGVIPRVMLTEIHRQAKKSAIVTHSVEIRNGRNPLPSSKALGETVHGALKDLHYNIVGEDSNILLEVSKIFSNLIKEGEDIMDIQIVSPIKNNGSASCARINTICQKIYNGDESLPFKEVGRGDDMYILRQGDKVINVKNNYNTKSVSGANTPIYNGSIGIISGFERIYDTDDEKYYNVTIVEFEGIGKIALKDGELNSIELAYCISIHKSQGMGVKNVIVAYPFAYTLVSRQSLYTAITRAKTKCFVVIEYRTLKYAVGKDATKKKQTYLAEILFTISNELKRNGESRKLPMVNDTKY